VLELETNMIDREEVVSEIHVRTFWQFYDVKNRLDTIEEQLWRDFYNEATEEQDKYSRIEMLEKRANELTHYANVRSIGG